MPRTQVNKAHKTRFSSKSTRNAHKIPKIDKGRISKPQRNVVKGSRVARLQQSKKIRDEKRTSLMKEKKASGGSCSPPVIVLFGLSGDVDLSTLARDLLALSGPNGATFSGNTVVFPTFRLRASVLLAPHGDLLSCLEMAKIADFILFVVSANSVCHEGEDGFVDSFGSRSLSVLRALGLPSTGVMIRDLPNDTKKKQELKKMCSTFLSPELPEDCKIFTGDTLDELRKFMWLFKEQHLSSPHWRTHRPYLISHEIDVDTEVDDTGKCSLILSGYVRSHSYSVNQLVHISGAGDFQLSKIEILKDPFPLNVRSKCDSMDTDGSVHREVVRTLLPDPLKAEPLLVENVPDPLAGEQTWPTEAEMAEADATNRERKSLKLKKRTIPRGTSDYQAAWITSDTDNDENDYGGEVLETSDYEDERMLDEEADSFRSDNSDIDEGPISTKDADDETEADMMTAEDENWTAERVKEEMQKLRDEHAEDEEFPDEVETPMDIPAKKRFAKYRGLKSFRTSTWDPKESLPLEYARTFGFDNFQRTHKHVIASVLERDQKGVDECAPIGSYVKLHVSQVPKDIVSQVCSQSESLPVVVSGLLPHESKMSVLHFSIKKSDNYDAPIKSKEPLIFHVGFRRFLARPIFSSDDMHCDKHKMERFLHAGRFSVASVYAPISFPPLPLIAMKHREGVNPDVAAFGSLRSVNPDRIILKKIVLSGYPQRVSKLKAAVRFMFHNPDDVRWFKPVELWTKFGRRGRIKEPVGTHGSMKCLFNGVVQQHDTVCMSLYKRVYPKWPESLYSLPELSN